LSYQDIEAAGLDALLQRDDLWVIDMRDPQTQSLGQLPNAQPHTDAVISRLVRQRRNDPPVLVYCYQGNDSRDLCSFLAQLGLNQVYHLVGGWAAWEKLVQPLTATTAPQLSTSHLAWLITHGFDPQDLNSRVGLGMTSLMLAALQGKHALVDELLALGADPRAVNDDEHHALWFACVQGDVALVKQLIDHGSNVNNRNVNGVTCTMYAASTGKLDVLKTLVEAGADLSIRTPEGIDTLESASTLPVLRYLRPLISQTA